MQSSKIPLGLYLIGGKDSNSKSLSSVEVLGFDNCSVPDLPEWRYNHASFVTKWGALAVCGGFWDGKPFSSDCLVLNKTSKKWERNVLGDIFGNTVWELSTLILGLIWFILLRLPFFQMVSKNGLWVQDLQRRSNVQLKYPTQVS